MQNDVIGVLTGFVPLLATVAAVLALLGLTNWVLRRHWRDDPSAQFRFQFIMLALTFAGGLTIIVALPITDALRGQLLSLIGILLSAAIALSSTTFIGNIMAGVMLRVMRNARPGDFITVADLTGRITEMDLLHTEIQTEFRDLVTVPNLYMVTQPMQVVRASGTIITAEVSLGYDVGHRRVVKLLREATHVAGLKDGFVQVRELGDFSIVYRVAGLLEDVKSLISARSRLREAMLDALHDGGIEIVSPNFMTTRALDPQRSVIPVTKRRQPAPARTQGEDVAFDKAEDAASVESLRKDLQKLEAALLAANGKAAVDTDDDARAALQTRRDALRARLAEAEALIRAKADDD